MKLLQILAQAIVAFARIFLPVPQPEPPKPAPEPQPAPEPLPPGEALDNTWVWKPMTDTLPKRACVITPARLDLESVSVCYGRKQAKCEIAMYRGPRANGGRQHWLLHLPGRRYGRNLKVIGVDRELKTERTWEVPDGSQRLEIR